MKPRTRSPSSGTGCPKPLWRFGWPGWCALAVGIPVLALAAAAGNPIYEAQRLVMERWDVPTMFQFTIWWLVYPRMQLTSIAPGPFVLTWVLLAFGLSPRRVSPLWCAYFVLLCLATPMLHAPVSLRNFLSINSLLQLVHLGGWTSLNAIEILLLAAGLWRFTGSWRVFAAIVAASACCLVPWEITWSQNLGSWDWEPYWHATVILWHAICSTTVIAWGIAERGRFSRWWICNSCGYDLRGSGASRCPECGASTANHGVAG